MAILKLITASKFDGMSTAKLEGILTDPHIELAILTSDRTHNKTKKPDEPKVKRPNSVNKRNLSALIRVLNKYKTYGARGVWKAPDRELPDLERSIIVIGISLDEAIKQACRFNQEAIMYKAKGHTSPMLYFLGDYAAITYSTTVSVMHSVNVTRETIEKYVKERAQPGEMFGYTVLRGASFEAEMNKASEQVITTKYKKTDTRSA